MTRVGNSFCDSPARAVITHLRSVIASICLATVGAGVYLLGCVTLRGAPQQGSNARASSGSRHRGSAKRTWHSGPASTPPETEVVPPPPPNPPPVTAPILGLQEERNKPAAANTAAVSPLSAMVSAHSVALDYSNAPDPEALRIRDELQRLRDNASARLAFYDDLRRTVEQVRAGMKEELRDEDPSGQNAPSSHPSPIPPHDTSREPSSPRTDPPANSPASGEPHDSQPANPGAPQASLGTSEGSRAGKIDRTSYLRVVRWARANGAPVPLALAVAWMESHLRPDPPPGNAGEIGTFQIMPARCWVEGWPPRRLNEPEFNVWLGTRLLARYYQEENSWARAAAKYVAGPGVFDRSYPKDVWAFINRYASAVNSYAGYFARYQS